MASLEQIRKLPTLSLLLILFATSLSGSSLAEDNDPPYDPPFNPKSKMAWKHQPFFVIDGKKVISPSYLPFGMEHLYWNGGGDLNSSNFYYGFSEDCVGQNVCGYASFSTEPISNPAQIAVKSFFSANLKTVPLKSNISGYYRTGNCYAYCNENIMSWFEHGKIFQLGCKMPGEENKGTSEWQKSALSVIQQTTKISLIESTLIKKTLNLGIWHQQKYYLLKRFAAPMPTYLPYQNKKTETYLSLTTYPKETSINAFFQFANSANCNKASCAIASYSVYQVPSLVQSEISWMAGPREGRIDLGDDIDGYYVAEKHSGKSIQYPQMVFSYNKKMFILESTVSKGREKDIQEFKKSAATIIKQYPQKE